MKIAAKPPHAPREAAGFPRPTLPIHNSKAGRYMNATTAGYGSATRLALASGSPVALTAAQRVSIRPEYASEGPEQGSLSLNRDSFTRERQRVPTAFLYPAATN